MHAPLCTNEILFPSKAGKNYGPSQRGERGRGKSRTPLGFLLLLFVLDQTSSIFISLFLSDQTSGVDQPQEVQADAH